LSEIIARRQSDFIASTSVSSPVTRRRNSA
jgi:hypothetical protein